MNTLPNFKCGTGSGNNLKLYTGNNVLRRSQTYNNSMLLNENIASIETSDDELSAIRITPGYFYLYDREIYAYNTKITEIQYPVLSGDLTYVDLIGRPDGVLPLLLEYSDIGRSTNYTDYGFPPVLIQTFSSGDLESYNIYLDTFISSETGVDGQIGYSYVDDVFYSGDPDDIPFEFSPLSRYAKGYEYWREDNILPYDSYYYDISTNRIYFSGDFSDKQVLINYEGINEPFNIDMEMSPLYSIPEDYIVSLSSSNLIDEEVGTIRIYNNIPPIAGLASIRAEVLSINGNHMPDTSVSVCIKRRDIDTGEYDYDIVPYFYSGDTSIDEIVIQPLFLLENDVMICNDKRISGSAYINGSGYLTSDKDDTYESSAGTLELVTDNNGIASFYYHSPSLKYNINVDIEVSADDVSSTSTISLKNTDDPVFSNSDYKTYDKYVLASSSSGAKVKIEVPSDCISPSSMMAAYGSAALEKYLLIQSADSDFVQPESISEESGIVYVTFNMTNNDTSYLIKYYTYGNVIKGNNTRLYAKLY